MERVEQQHLEGVRETCAAMLRATGAERVSVWVLNERAGTVSPLVAAGGIIPLADVARRWSRLPVGGVAAEVLRSRQPAFVSNMRVESSVPAGLVEELGASSLWVAPLEVGGRAVGLVVVESALVAGGHPPMGSQMQVMAHQVGQARAWRDAAKRQAEAELLLELAEISLEGATVANAQAQLCTRIASCLGLRRACLYMVPDDGGPVLCVASGDDGSAAQPAPSPVGVGRQVPSIVAAALAQHQAVVVHTDSPDLRGALRGGFDVASLLAIAVGPPGSPVGVLTLADPRPRRFTDPFLVRIATAAAASMARLCEGANVAQGRGRNLRTGVAVRELLRTGSSATNVTEAGAVIARVGRSALDCDHACAFLVDDDGVICDVIGVNIKDAWQERLRGWVLWQQASEVPLGVLLLGTREPVVVSDASESDLLPAEMVADLALKTFVAIPLWSSSRFHGGVIYSSARSLRSWSSEDRHLVEQLALESALVIENAQLRAAERAHTEQLAYLALHDALTGLPNRVLLADRLAAALRETARTRAEVAVLFVDLTSFKDINDRLGHDIGDALLVEVASRMEAVVRPGDTVARLAGDEFVLVLRNVSARVAVAVATRLCDAIAVPTRIGGHVVHVTAGVGIALGASDTATAPELLRRADTAMYRAKRRPSGGYEVFDATIDST